MKQLVNPLIGLIAWTVATLAQAVSVGQPAPAFEIKDTSSKLVKLADFKGKHVVLEWTNPSCPFVQKHYSTRNMQRLQKDAATNEVVWLSISSTAPSHGAYLTPKDLSAKYQSWGASALSLLMDDNGRVGKLYAVRTTPHMYIVDPKGVLVYAGGIDDKRSANPADVATAKKFVQASLGELLAGKPVSTPTSAPYGCRIKYASH